MKIYASILFLLVSIIPLAAFSQGYVLDKETIFNDQVEVMIPTNFFLADDELIEARYPDEATRPDIIYTDETETALLSLSMVENSGEKRDTIVKLYKLIKDDIRGNYPTHRFLKTDVIRHRRLGNIEVILPNPEGETLYNMMGFMYVEDQFFSFNFSCPEEDMEKWQNMAREIAENLKLTF